MSDIEKLCNRLERLSNDVGIKNKVIVWNIPRRGGKTWLANRIVNEKPRLTVLVTKDGLLRAQDVSDPAKVLKDTPIVVCDGGLDVFEEGALLEMCERVHTNGGTVFILGSPALIEIPDYVTLLDYATNNQ